MWFGLFSWLDGLGDVYIYRVVFLKICIKFLVIFGNLIICMSLNVIVKDNEGI